MPGIAKDLPCGSLLHQLAPVHDLDAVRIPGYDAQVMGCLLYTSIVFDKMMLLVFSAYPKSAGRVWGGNHKERAER